jgi:3-methyladenine DNA glycosylase AlkC
MDENNLFREAFNREVVEQIADGIASVYDGFKRDSYLSCVMQDFKKLGFGERATRIEICLEQFLPAVFSESARILVDSLGPEPEVDSLSGFDGFYIFPLCMYISKNGIDYPDIALSALYEMTKRFTAESDIRPFIKRYPEQALHFLMRLTEDPSPFARRLASEGTRPRLPLAGRLKEFQQNPSPVIKLLDRLYTDANLMVRRSVANNINDISKDNPDIAVATLGRWLDETPNEETAWIVRHGLRTLVKKDHPGALALLGYQTLGIQINNWQISTRDIKLGDSITFSWDICSTTTKKQKLAINYVIYFVGANTQLRRKVFRMPDKTLKGMENITISKTHVFRNYKNQSFYSGTHFIEFSVNGKKFHRTDFELAVS